ncbi:MAG: hypothetical protein R3322_13460, partial [Kiloniellales bacterium]|nr:hypothetical protein [Kiloniellales bacterium]
MVNEAYRLLGNNGFENERLTKTSLSICDKIPEIKSPSLLCHLPFVNASTLDFANAGSEPEAVRRRRT